MNNIPSRILTVLLLTPLATHAAQANNHLRTAGENSDENCY